ncbi:MAG: anthrone oxygenase family protein [Acidimicrobiales bacterium]
MSPQWEVLSILVGLIAAAVAGGAFFAFSNFVIPALSALPAAAGASAMQAINRAAPNPTFIAVLLLGVVAGVPVLVAEIDSFSQSETNLVAVAVALSAASFAITMTRNVPKNNKLDTVDAESSAGAAYWERYVRTWTLDNTLRGLASTASAAMYALSLLVR